MSQNDYTLIREAGTSAPNYDLDTEAILEHLESWENQCSFHVVDAGPDTIEIEFESLPEDLDTFVENLYELCPDLVDQGTGALYEQLEVMEEAGEEPDEDMQDLIEGVDFDDDSHGLEILKRALVRDQSVRLWWD